MMEGGFKPLNVGMVYYAALLRQGLRHIGVTVKKKKPEKGLER